MKNLTITATAAAALTAGFLGLAAPAPIRGTVQDDFNDRTYQQTVTGYVYYVDVR
ncbi:hypothetical protein [Mycolicibacterium aurum]|uniref:hypothetical protein n=1 Tax=Mycolicibacterium aurum TaxID=1791 RepID=UPI0018E306A4|nr:hypothetical protein [Mycolicibacterium aurum]